MLAAPLAFTRRRVLALAAVISASFAVGAGLSLGLPLLSLVLEARGISSTWIGLNTAVAGIAIIAVAPLVTPLARRLGPVPLLFGGIVAAAAILPLFYVVEAFWAWFPLRFAFHAALAFSFVLSEFWINMLAPPERRGLVLGVYATVLSLGFALGPLLLGLTGSQGLLPFVVGAVAIAASALPLLWALDERPEIEDRPTGGMLRYVRAAPVATFGVLAFGAIESGGIALLPLYGLRLGFNEASATALVAAAALGNVVFQIPLGLLADRVDRPLLLKVCAAIGLSGCVIAPFVAGSLPALLSVLFLWGGVVAGLYTVGLAHLGARFTGADLAAANAAFVMMYAIGMVVGLPGLGLALDLAPPHGLVAGMGVIFAAYLALGLFGGRLARS